MKRVIGTRGFLAEPAEGYLVTGVSYPSKERMGPKDGICILGSKSRVSAGTHIWVIDDKPKLPVTLRTVVHGGVVVSTGPNRTNVYFEPKVVEGIVLVPRTLRPPRRRS